MVDKKLDSQAARQARDTFIKGTFILTIGSLVVKVIGSLNWIFVSRILGGEGMGLYQMAFPIYLLALSISSAGIPVAISIITAEKLALGNYHGARRVFYVSLSVLGVTGLLFSMLMFFGAEWLTVHHFIRDPRAYYSIVALAPAIFFVTILSSFRGYLQGWQYMTPTALSQIVEQLFRVITMIIFASLLLPKGIAYAAAGASFGAAPGAAFGLLVLIYYYFKVNARVRATTGESNFPAESKSQIIGSILRLSLPVTLASIMLPVVSNIDLLIVPIRLEDAGYSVGQATELFGYLTGMAVPLVNLATILPASLGTSLVPAISEAKAINDRAAIQRHIAAAVRLTSIVTIPAAVMLWLLDTAVAQMIYNEPKAGPVVGVMSAGIFILGLHQVTTGVLQGMGHTIIPVINMGLSAIGKIIFNWTLTGLPQFGIKGAAIATLVDFSVAALLNLIYVTRYTGYFLKVKDLFIPIISAAIMGAAIVATFVAIADVLNNNSLATLIAALAGGVAYFFVMILLGGVVVEDIRRLPVIGTKLAKVLQSLGILRR
jgi:stage V sporulation protein B